MIVQKTIEKWKRIRKRAVELSKGNYYLLDSELFVVDNFIKDLESIEKGGDMMEGKMVRQDIATKEGIIGKLESKTAVINEMSSDILTLSMGIESFLMGASPMAKSEKAENKPAGGWLNSFYANLIEVEDKLGLALNYLRSVENLYK